MNRVPVESRAVVSVGYYDGVFEIELTNGRIYACEATREEYESFLSSESKGKALQAFRPRLARVGSAEKETADAAQ